MKNSVKNIFFFLLSLDLKAPFRFESLSNALRRGFSVDTNMFSGFLSYSMYYQGSEICTASRES